MRYRERCVNKHSQTDLQIYDYSKQIGAKSTNVAQQQRQLSLTVEKKQNTGAVSVYLFLLFSTLEIGLF